MGLDGSDLNYGYFGKLGDSGLIEIAGARERCDDLGE